MRSLRQSSCGWRELAWLSKKEGRKYRLPTDREWSFAVGIGSEEKWAKETTPESLNSKVANEFPWEGDFPPKTRDRAGNYADTSWHEKFPTQPWMVDCADGHVTPAPVMCFKPNKLGLYDMGGNVLEWVEDWSNATQKDRVMRGASFILSSRDQLLSSLRIFRPPGDRNYNHHGFRIVVELTAP